MPPTLALMLWLVLLLALLRFDPAKEPGTSWALWVPLIWMFFESSRLPSQWLGFTGGIAAQALEEGNPLDRSILFLFIVLSVFVLTLRAFNWGGFFSRNLYLMAFLLFALASVVWSDFPLVALKRWFRDLGNYFAVLVVLSDPHPLDAMRSVLRRLFYLLIPLSVLLVKYFPGLSRHYNSWTGAAEYVGAATSKNMLGNICMVSVIFFVWDTMTRWSSRKERANKLAILVNICFVLITLWLLNLAQSATSQVCLLIGCALLMAIQSAWAKRHLMLIRFLIPAAFCVYLILAFGLDLNGQMASVVGRDPTLTDRTLIWHVVLNEHTNPVLGTGYESFWLGSRLDRIWEQVGPVNEAHDGYLEAYLNLGGIGLGLLLAFLLASYGTIFSTFKTSAPLAKFNLVVWATILFYNVTEAAFRSGLMWLMLLLGGLVIPERSQDQFTRSQSNCRKKTLEKSGSPNGSSAKPATARRNPAPREKIKSGIGPVDILRGNT